ncbi:MAG: hypothetical protein JNL49_06975 [Bacteroidia bacterium]|nr:hypothetical protein [Bacteroidia bacterium]
MIDRLFNKKTKEQKFWLWFQENSDKYLTLDKDNQESLFDKLNERIIKIDPNLAFEFSPFLKNGKREFIISADGIIESFPSVTKLVDAAPKIPNWDIIAFRQPNSGYKQINYNGLSLSIDDVFFRYSKDNGKLGLELNIRGYEDKKEWTAITFLVLDMVLGEYDTEMSLSWIEKKELDEREVDILYNLSELPKILSDYKIESRN